jgi:hypothetical protein
MTDPEAKLLRPIVAGDLRSEAMKSDAGEIEDQRDRVQRQCQCLPDPKDRGNVLLLLDHHHDGRIYARKLPL